MPWNPIPESKAQSVPLEFAELDQHNLWGFAAAALATAWPLVWVPYNSRVNETTRARQLLWRAPAGLCLGIIPPLGVIGWASPVTAAGFLFPGIAWCGLVACIFVTGALAVWPRQVGIVTVAIAFVANLVYPADPRPLAGWQGINTQFGAIAHETVSPIAEYEAAQKIQETALSSTANVIVFPETVVPTWTAAATDTFWQPTLARLRASGKTILIGARVSSSNATPSSSPVFDFSADLRALTARQTIRFPALPVAESTPKSQPALDYDNGDSRSRREPVLPTYCRADCKCGIPSAVRVRVLILSVRRSSVFMDSVLPS